MRPFLGLIRVLFFGFVVSTAANNMKCQNPKVRYEWRKLSGSQRTEWINAVKVFIPSPAVSTMLSSSSQCLTTLPHDPRLTPSVPTNVSLIPPVNETSSFFDGMQRLNAER